MITLQTEKKTEFNVSEIIELYLDKKYDELSQKFIDLFNINFDEQDKTSIDLFIDTFLYIFTKQDYILSSRYANDFIHINNMISNLVSISSYGNTDAQLVLLKDLSNNFCKILTLYSARNMIKIDPEIFFNISTEYASLWYFSYFFLESFSTRIMNQNIVEHINNVNPGLTSSLIMHGAYFISTYYDTANDRKIKSKVNEFLQDNFKNITIKNTPNKKKIAIITSFWKNFHSVYKSIGCFINELFSDYELTLIHLGCVTEDIEKDKFEKIKFVYLVGDQSGQVSLQTEDLAENDYIMAIYPDIGMGMESIYLSNLRIAPIQVAMYGHPVSTFGSRIDYYIGGTDVEVENLAQENYSERLVLIPGIGAYPVYPNYKRKNIKNKTDAFIINCAWGANKFNYEMILTLKEIIKLADKKVVFRFFPGPALMHSNRFASCKNEIGLYLPKENTELYPSVLYEDYMTIIEEGDLGIDAYPFGGYNTIVDLLYTGKPVITFEGTAAYNRLSSALMKRLGLNELVATNRSEYITKIVDIINNDDYRNYLNEKIKKIDLHDKIFDTDEPGYFKKAVDYLIDNHWKLKDDKIKSPIIIK